MGGGDLNMKKSWHPGLVKNRAQVWEDQNAALQERKRIEALKKEIEEERAAKELQKLNEANGGPKRRDRVEFLYSGSGAGSAPAAEDREAYLLGKRRVNDILGKDVVDQQVALQNPAASATNVSKGINLRDVANKVAMDPLLAIKKKEAAMYEALVNKKKAELEMEARKKARRDARGVRRPDREDMARSHRHSGREERHSRRPRSSSSDRDYHSDSRDHRHSHRRRSRSPDRERRHTSHGSNLDGYRGSSRYVRSRRSSSPTESDVEDDRRKHRRHESRRDPVRHHRDD